MDAAAQPASLGELEGDFQLAALIPLPVLVTAESRDRRHQCARFIHTASHCGHGPFVTFSGNGHDLALGEDDVRLWEQFEQARGGTLYIDDIAVLSSEAQTLLLFLLDDSAPLHASTGRLARPSVRVIGGAPRYLADERATGAFSQLLFYRLNVVHIDLMGHTA